MWAPASLMTHSYLLASRTLGNAPSACVRKGDVRPRARILGGAAAVVRRRAS